MMDQAKTNTDLLFQASAGDPSALSRILPVIYDELRRFAHRQLAGEPDGRTLDTTALVHEAYLRLIDQTRVEWQSRARGRRPVPAPPAPARPAPAAVRATAPRSA